MQAGGFLQYFNREHPLYEGKIVGQSSDGFPVIGNQVPLTTQREYEQLPLSNTFRSRMFCLWKEADKAAYDEVMDHVWNGLFFVKAKLVIEVPEAPGADPGGSIKVWLEWTQVTAQAGPATAPDAIHAHLAGSSATVPL